MFALIDCNSFFCSVEQAFRPELKGKAVIVLGGNDGCIVALTPEAKAVGLHRGDPFFKVKTLVETKKVVVFSADLRKYSAVSKQINAILREYIQEVDTYSIDECFCNLKGHHFPRGMAEYMREIAAKILEKTDIPVSVGIAESKTLAKMGSKFAKQYRGYRGVCVIDSEEKRLKALEIFDLSDVWGIGRKTFYKLSSYGIKTPLEFAQKNESWVKARFPKPVVQTWFELNGRPCIDTRESLRNKSISMSRSFGNMQSTFLGVQSAVSTFAASCSASLRSQGSVARVVTVWLSTNRFREDLSQYQNVGSVTLEVPTSDTIEIINAATTCLKTIFREGYLYKKAGVMVSDLRDDSCIEQSLFDTVKNRPARRKLMEAIDNLNAKAGKNVVKICAEGLGNESWHGKREH